MALLLEGIEMVSAAAAAKALGTTEMKILMLLRQKALSGQQVGGAWFVTAPSLAECDPAAVVRHEGPPCALTCSASGCSCR